MALLIPFNLKVPRTWLSLAMARSPCRTLISTVVWKLAAVVKIWLYLVGIVEFRSISLVATPPAVSMDKDNGVTSINKISFKPASPAIFPPWIAAPRATHSSGFMFLLGSLPVNCLTFSETIGILVEPPTNSTIWRSLVLIPASDNAWWTGPAVWSIRSEVSSSNLDLVNVISICLGPSFPTAINGRLTCTVIEEDNSFFAFSASSLILWTAVWSLDRSIPSAFLNSPIR